MDILESIGAVSLPTITAPAKSEKKTIEPVVTKLNKIDGITLPYPADFYKNFNFEKQVLKSMREKQIKIIISRLTGGPVQGSSEWKKARNELGYLGGSELNTIYRSKKNGIKQIIGRKLGFGPVFNGNLATRWGNVFENVAKLLVMKKFKVDTIYEFSRIKDKIQNLSYSPDGIFLMKHKKKIDDLTIIRYLITLLEFKCPFSREPKGEIPEEYKLQINAGLLHISGLNAGLFVNSMFRRCPMDNLYEKCIARGVIIIKDKNYNSDSDSGGSDNRQKIADLGEFADAQLNRIFQKLEDKKNLFIDHIDLEFSNPETDKEKHMLKYKSKNEIYGILPWKLLKCDMIMMDPDPDYLDTIKKIISDYLYYANMFIEAPKEKHKELYESLF